MLSEALTIVKWAGRRFKQFGSRSGLVSFLAKDDGWYLTIMMRFHGYFTEDEFARVYEVIEEVAYRAKLPSPTGIEIHDDHMEVRLVDRLAIFTQSRIEDDVPAILCSLNDHWTILLPLIYRARNGGEATAKIIADGIAAFAKLHAPQES